MRLLIKAVLAFAMSIAAPMQAAAIRPIILHNASDIAGLDKKVSWFYDASGTLTIDEILNQGKAQLFIPHSERALPFAYFDQPFWLQFEVSNQSQVEKWYLAAFSSVVEDIEVYEITEKSDGLAWKQKEPIKGKRYGAVALDIPQGSAQRFFVKFRTYDPPLSLFTIQSEDSLVNRDAEELPFYGVIVGVFLALILYNLFLCFSLRRRIHSYYVLFAVGNGYLALISVNIPIGILENLGLIEWGHFLRFIAPLSLTLFTQAFFDSKKLCPRLHRYAQGFLAIYASLLIYQFLTGDKSHLNQIIDILMLGTIICISSIAALAYLAGNSSAKYSHLS